ncbi:MAG: GIY-YIG nuclease family protein, partial [Gemmatimonadetes bacterium]|nr:GIY-YIG nuclease family protein [Gemmatimonadota bacterium]
MTEHGHPPRHGEGLDIFERLYAVRLDRIRGDETLRALVASSDHQGLLGEADLAADPATMNLEELAADLAGIGEVKSDLTNLRH